MNSPCAITSLVQSPALDVVGIGFSTGEVSLYDIRADERLLRIFMDGGSIRSLAFRSGELNLNESTDLEIFAKLLFSLTDGEPILATASSNGHIAMWDLNSGGRLIHVIRGAHDSSVNAIEWVPGQPLLISSGSDNSVKVNLPRIAPKTSFNMAIKAMGLRFPDNNTPAPEISLRTFRATSLDSLLW